MLISYMQNLSKNKVCTVCMKVGGLFYITNVQVVQGDRETSILGNIQKPFGHGPGQPAVEQSPA